jgi:hypothetical protein
MSATATRPPFADASPAEIRAALLPEDQGSFDQEYRDALAEAGEDYHLDRLEQVLSNWRRVAWAVYAQGPDDYRAMLARAEHTLATGERMPGAVSWRQVKAELGL